MRKGFRELGFKNLPNQTFNSEIDVGMWPRKETDPDPDIPNTNILEQKPKAQKTQKAIRHIMLS